MLVDFLNLLVFLCFVSTILGFYPIVASHLRGDMPEHTVSQSLLTLS